MARDLFAGAAVSTEEKVVVRDLFPGMPMLVDKQQPEQLAPEESEKLPEGDLSDVVIEPLVAMASGLAGTIAGGIAGIGTTLLSGGEKGEEVIKDIQQGAAEFGKPETQRGQAALVTLGDLMEKGLDLARFPISGFAGLASLIAGQGIDDAVNTVKSVQEKGIGKVAGDKTFEATGDVLLSTLAEVAPEIIGSIFPLTKIMKTRSALREKIADEIRSGSESSDLVKYMVDGSNKLRTDKLAQAAIKQGYSPSTVMAYKGSSNLDKTKMLEMTYIREKGNKNALYQVDNRPSDVPGNSLLERLNYVKGVNLKAGKEIDAVADTLIGKTVNFEEAINRFSENLDGLGVRLSKTKQPIFFDSAIEFSAGPRKAVSNMLEILLRGKPGVTPDAFRLHTMKRRIDELVTYGIQGEGVTGQTQRVLKELRHDINTALGDAFPKYKEVNTRYSDTIKAMDELQAAAGKKMELFGPNADKAVGTLLRRMMSNIQSRVNLTDAVTKLEAAAKKYGGNFEDNIKVQMLLADDLDAIFGAVARNSLAGEMGKEIKRGADIVLGQKTAAGIAAEVAVSIGNRAIGINEENAFKSIRALLERQ